MAKSKFNKPVQIQRAIIELLLPADNVIVETAELHRRYLLAINTQGEEQEQQLRAASLGQILKWLLRDAVGGANLDIRSIRHEVFAAETSKARREKTSAKGGSAA